MEALGLFMSYTCLVFHVARAAIVMSRSNLNYVKVLQAIIIAMLHLETEFFIAGSCWRIGSDANATCVEKERRALMNMKEAFVDEDGRLASWGSSPDCCQWSGVLCNPHTGHVEKLDLHGDFDIIDGDPPSEPLRGEISPSLIDLQYLNYLNLCSNDFNGSEIPKIFGSLTKLRYLELCASSFGGKIPIELGKLSNLRVLDLSYNGLVDSIPFQFGNLSSLQELRLDGNHLVGNIPSQLGNLSSLQILSIGYNDDLKIDDNSLVAFEWLSNLQSLTSLDLSSVSNLNYSNNLLSILGKLPNLRELLLRNCSLTDINILSTPPSHLNFSTSLVNLDLGENQLTSSLVIPWLFNLSSNLAYLNLFSNQLSGPIPGDFGNNMNSLVHLDLSGNELNGTISDVHFGNITKLQYLDLSDNSLSGPIPGDFGNNMNSLVHLDLSGNELNGTISDVHFGNITKLQYLDLSDNSLSGPIPGDFGNNMNSLVCLDLSSNELNGTISDVHFGNITKLQYLDLSDNSLSGPIPGDFGNNMNSLVYLHLSSNELNGTISDVHFDNITKLQYLDLSGNSLSLKFSNHWVPPFQLRWLILWNCKLGPGFPRWLRTQNNLQALYVSDAEINDSVPEWFWRLVAGARILVIESSNLTGTISDLPLEFNVSYIILASNQIKGSVPLFLLKSTILDISGNQISKFVLSCGNGIGAIVENLVALNLSSNNLSGKLPYCWDYFKSLKVLDLSNNQLSGRIPNSIGSLSQLEQVVLRNNCFSGGLPSLENATKLGMLDLEKNDLSGPIPPSWTRNNLKELETLSLRMNKLDGKLPFHLCYLTKLRVLHLSFNKFTGPIPSCLNNLVAMTQEHVINDSIGWITLYNNGKNLESIDFNWFLPMVWKGTERVYKDSYGLLNSIDLSHNQLVGEMPLGLGKLVGLQFLNLSSNELSGKIISGIGQLKSLETLDLSRNHFHGEIPSSLAEISSLSVLDVSNNNLSGEIPTGTQLQSFEPSSYEGNPDLCGRPLDKLCHSEDHPLGKGTQSNQNADEDHSFIKGFYESLGVGFAVGFWIVFGSLLLNRSWRQAYFNFVSKLSESIYVTTMLLMARWRRWLHN